MPAGGHTVGAARPGAGRYRLAGHAQWPEHLASALGRHVQRLLREPGQFAQQRRANALRPGAQRLPPGDRQPGLGRARAGGACYAAPRRGLAGVQPRYRRARQPAGRLAPHADRRTCTAGHGFADVHLGHHGCAQGRGAHAGQFGGQCPCHQRRAPPASPRPGAGRLAALPYQRLCRHHAGAFGAWWQPGHAAEVFGGALLAASHAGAVHLDQCGADHDLLSAGRRRAGPRGFARHRLLPQRLGGAAAGALAGF